MDIQSLINKLYYDIALNELKISNQTLYAKISYNSLLYMDIIAYRQNCTSSYIADTLQIAKSAVTSKTNELIKLGLVKKTQSANDKRIFYLSIEDEFISTYTKLDKRLETSINDLKHEFRQDELNVFCNVLNKLCSNISKSYEEESEKNE